MPPKPKFTREAVIEAGMMQLKDQGWEGLTPKAVAKRLGASTMPIFSHFATMQEFREAILDQAWEIQTEYATRSYTGDVFVDQGIGYVLFAKDHGRLFACMNDGRHREYQLQWYLRFWDVLTKQLEGYPPFAGMNERHTRWIRYLRSMLSHGIAVSVSSGLGPLWEREEVIERMLALCTEVLCEGLSQRVDQLDDVTRDVAGWTGAVLSFARNSGEA
jgi:AcrR family transcriptional regulator